MSRLPPWLKTRLGSGETYGAVRELTRGRGLNTVCTEARCPNAGECWSEGTATFMILGDTCTRACRFCSVAASALPPAPDPEEPARLAESVEALALKYAVVTTVCRDDLPDQGARHAAACLRAVKERCPKARIEFLSQDFRGDESLLGIVLSAEPDVFGHNLETVERLSPKVRDAKADYRRSLGVLKAAKRLKPGLRSKSSLMLGFGETEADVQASFQDLLEAGVSVLTLGQYLRPTPSKRHLPVEEYLEPKRFERYGDLAKSLGFAHVSSGPFVRSSYKAAELFLGRKTSCGAHHG
ncbi:MAG TPA: lipoyl synthase [Elusimicrobia bacterium]|nr:lipoyl synthase [Elusimicrobiota bacterium]